MKEMKGLPMHEWVGYLEKLPEKKVGQVRPSLISAGTRFTNRIPLACPSHMTARISDAKFVDFVSFCSCIFRIESKDGER